MAVSHHLVVERWVNRNFKFSLRGSNIYADEHRIYSYGPHFPMAIADDERQLFVVNGDRWGPTTSHHQSILRAEISRSDWTHFIIPFSALNAANVRPETLTLIEQGKEINDAGCRTCNLKWDNINYADDWNAYRDHNNIYGHGDNRHDIWTRHLLAPTLLTGNRDGNLIYLLSGFDETATTFGGGYFLSQLPKRVKSIDEAFLSLRPAPVLAADKNNVYVKRQGDIFGVPTNLTTRKLKKIGGKVLPEFIVEEKVLLDWDNKPFHTEYVKTDTVVDRNESRWINGNPRPRLLSTNHYATEAIVVEKNGKQELYARGVLYHRPVNTWGGERGPDHKNIKLGKLWHKIYRNTAVGSWSSSSNGRGRVD